MKIKLGNWIINFSAHPEKLGFWWTKQHEIRLANSTTVKRDENGRVEVIREFFTARALIYGAYYLAEKRIAEYFKGLYIKLAEPEFALRLAFPLALLWITRVPLVIFGVIEYQSESDAPAETTSSLTVSHTTPAGSERLAVGTSGCMSDDIDSMTYGGSAMTRFNTVGNTDIGIAYKIAPSTGAQDFTTSRSGGSTPVMIGTIVSLTGAHQTSVDDGTANSGVQGVDGSVSITTTEGGVMVFGGYGSWAGSGGSGAASGNLTQLNAYWNGANNIRCAYTYKESAGLVSFTNDATETSGFSRSGLQGFRSATPPVSGPSNLKSYNTNLKANIKSICTNLIANVKSLNTNT